jgi:hypothetical protein
LVGTIVGVPVSEEVTEENPLVIKDVLCIFEAEGREERLEQLLEVNSILVTDEPVVEYTHILVVPETNQLCLIIILFILY